MNSILVQIPEWGTGRRAALEGIRSGGKTGTTQSYRDGWYVGFTGNYTAAVWFGNDDYSPTRRMTGGSLPAMTWQRLMTYAHQNVELKPIPGVEAPVEVEVAAAGDGEAGEEGEGGNRPRVMTSRTTRTLQSINELFRAAPALSVPREPEALSSL
jgi:penicillin-binding protein 1A